MKRACFFLFLLHGFFSVQSVAQTNLVANPSFEDTIQCVDNNSRFQGYVADWRGGRGDYFSQHCQGFQVEVPQSALGYQFPRTGAAYAGIYTAVLDNAPFHDEVRDYAEALLLAPLFRGERYYVEMYVSLAEINQYVTPIQFAFTADTLTYNQYIIPLYPDVQETDLLFLGDTSNWVHVGGFYSALGNEEHFVIGNFQYDSLTPLYVFNAGAAQQTCYYFIDDVALYHVADARAGHDMQICLGDTVTLGGIEQPGVSYSWSTGATLSDSTTAFPLAFPSITTTYIVIIQDTSGNYYPGIVTDTVTVYVDSCTIPHPVLPWQLRTLANGTNTFLLGDVPDGLTFELFDIHGKIVYREENFRNTVTAEQFSAGMYIGVVTHADGTTAKEKIVISGR